MMPESAKPFSRFTARAARTLAAAGKLAAPGPMSSAHLAAALLAEPEGFAAKAIAVAGMTPEQLYAASAPGRAERAENTGSAELLDLSSTRARRARSRPRSRRRCASGTTTSAPSTCSSGCSSEGGPVTEAFTSLGLTPDRAERLIAEELAAYEAFKADKPMDEAA